jgi:uncharacterized protein (TIRG00374 family)
VRLSDVETAEVEFRRRIAAALPRMIIGGIIGLIALYLAFRGVSWPDLRDALARTNRLWLIAGFASVVASLVAYITRWWLLFTPDHRQRSWLTLAAATIVGQAVNIAIPARLGELARMYWVGSHEGISKVRVLATIVVEKAIEFGVFALSIVLLLVSVTLPPWLSRSGEALIILAAIVTVSIVILAFAHRRILVLVEKWSVRLPERWRSRVYRLAHSALQSLQFMRSWRMAAAVWLLSGVILVLSVTTNFLLLKASGINLPYSAALFLLVVIRLGEAPPSLPGKLGVFHYLVVLALSMFGVGRAVALSYAFVLYGVAVVPIVIAGAVLMSFFRRTEVQQPAS